MGPYGKVPRGWYPQTIYTKIFVSEISTDITKTFFLTWANQKTDFLGTYFGDPGKVAQKFGETKLRLQLNSFKQKLDFDVNWFWRRTYKI